MPGSYSNLLRGLPLRPVNRLGEGAPQPAGEAIGHGALAAAIGLAITAIAVPIATAALPGVLGLIGPPAFANILLGLLLFASAAVGLAAALFGLAQVGQSLAQAGHEPEQAVSRIFVLALLFGYAAAIAVPAEAERSASFELPLAAATLAAAWLLLLHILLQPAPSAVRRACGMVLDAAVVSALLHCGGETTAGGYPLYLVATCYTGFRFGVGALLSSAVLNLLGFAAVVASTEFWQQQPALTAGLILALIVLPALVAAPLRERAASQAAAMAAIRAKVRFLRVMTETLQPPLATTFDAVSPLDRAEPDLALLRLHIGDILALAAIEAGNFAPRSEAFDLHALVNETLGSRSRETATEGIALRWRIDPYLPYRVYGWRQPFERALRNLLDNAIATSEGGAVRVGLAALGGDAERVRLALTIDCAADPVAAAAAITADPLAADDADSGGNEFGVALARRIVELMGGRIRVDAVAPGQTRYTAEVDLAIDRRAADTELDLTDHPVLTVTGDREFAGDVVEALDACNADVRWIGEAEAALEYIAWVDPAIRAVLLVDGRSRPLSAVGFVDRVRVLGGAAPLILFIAEPGQISGLAELETGEFDALLPAPLSPQLLVNALHALPLRAERDDLPALAASAGRSRLAAADDAAEVFNDRVTPIAAHPRFAVDAVPAIDPRMVEALRELGGEDNFLREVIETFRADAEQVMRRLGRAAAIADTVSFAQGLRALRQAAGHVGGTQLCRLAMSLRGLTVGELRDYGSTHLQRLDAEIDRLAAGLLEYIGETEARRP